MRHGIVLCLALLGVGACGAGLRTFHEQGLSFRYPGDLETGDAVGAHPTGQVLGVVGAGANDYIAARGRPGTLPLARVRASLPSVLTGVTPATMRTERRSGLEMLTAVQRPDARTEARLWFFNGAGRTWEIECRSTQSRRDEIRSACGRALDSIRIG